VRANRLAILPLGAIAIVVLSYGLGAFGSASAAPPAQRASVDDPVSRPAVPAEAAAVGRGGATDTDQRIAFWQERIKANPSSDLQYQYLGELFSLKGRETGDVSQYALAIEAFERAVELYPGNNAARSALAVTLVTLHEWQAAIEQGTIVLQGDRRAYGAIAAIGDASLEVGDLDTADSAFETLRQVAGGPSVESRFARLAFLNGDTDEAIDILDAAAQAAYDLNRSAEEQAFYHYSAGEYRFGQGDVDGADRAYQAALDSLPGYYLAIAGQGRVAFARGDLDDAVASYQRAVAIIPKPELLAYLGDLYAVMGDQARAEEQYRAVEFIAQVGGPAANVANRELALFQASHGRDTANAVRLAEAELETRKDIYGYDAMAWALYNDGHPEAALEPARDALSLGTRDARLLYHAGMIEIAVGSEVAGRAHLRDALALNPAFDPLGADLAREALGD